MERRPSQRLLSPPRRQIHPKATLAYRSGSRMAWEFHTSSFRPVALLSNNLCRHCTLPGPPSDFQSRKEKPVVKASTRNCELYDQSWFNTYQIFFVMAILKFTLKRKNHFPIILHADDGPTVLLRLVIKCLRKRADLGVGQFLSRTVRIFSLCVVVQHEHRQARTVARLGVFEHLLVAGRVAKGDVRAPADHQMNAFRFARIIVVEHEL